jgi:hypothetical protein
MTTRLFLFKERFSTAPQALIIRDICWEYTVRAPSSFQGASEKFMSSRDRQWQPYRRTACVNERRHDARNERIEEIGF